MVFIVVRPKMLLEMSRVDNEKPGVVFVNLRDI